MSPGVILFGARSPLVVEYEEACLSSGRPIDACVSVEGIARVLDRSKLVALEDLTPDRLGSPFLACAFTPARRIELVRIARSIGLELAQALIHRSAIVASSVRIGEGTLVNAGCTLGAVSILGDNIVINRACSIGHHAMIEDDVSIGPGANLAGNVHVGQGSVIGAGAIVLPDIRIGRGAIIAAGSLIREHVPDDSFFAGSPAKVRPFDPSRSSLYYQGGE